jgi:PST family polysaccharide transporter
MRRGIFLCLSGQTLARILNFAFMVVLARLLTPRDYGLFNLANTVVGLAVAFGDWGLGSAFIQRQDHQKENASAAYSLNLLITLAGSVLLVLAAPAVAAFYKEPAAKSLLWILSFGFFLRGATFIHEASIRKSMRYGRWQAVLLTSTILYGAVAIIAARRGTGPWSLAWAVLAMQGGAAVLLVRMSGLSLSFRIDRARWRELLSYGKQVLAGGLVWAALLQADKIVVGKFLGAAALGAYAVAYNYGRMPLALLGSAVGEVMFSGLARVQNDLVEVRRLLVRSVSTLAIWAFPLAAVGLLLSKDAVAVFLGDRWSSAAVPLQIFSFAFPLTIIAAPFPSLYLALGRPRLILWMGLASAPLLFSAIFGGLSGGVVGTAAGVAVVMVTIAVAHFCVGSRLVGVSVSQFLRPLLFPALCSSSAFVLSELAGYILNTTFPLARLVIQGGIFLVIYGGVFGLRGGRLNRMRVLLLESLT